MRDDYYESNRYEEALETEKARRAEKKQLIRSVVLNLIYFLFSNLFAFLVYSIFISKYVKEMLQAGDDASGVVLAYSAIIQLVIVLVVSLRYVKESEENRRFLAASRQEGFTAIGYFVATLKRYGWLAPLTYFVFQLPFMLYHLALGYYYEAETTFAHFFIPQLFLMEKLGSVPGVLSNVLLFAVFYFTVIFLTQKSWLRNRIRA